MSNDPNAPQNFGTPPINNNQMPNSNSSNMSLAGMSPLNWLLVAGALVGGVVAGKNMKKSKKR
jgi:hypothetical protein